jgi:hypothetical protein
MTDVERVFHEAELHEIIDRETNGVLAGVTANTPSKRGRNGEGRPKAGIRDSAREIGIDRNRLHRSTLDTLEMAEQTGLFSMLMGRLPPDDHSNQLGSNEKSKRADGRGGAVPKPTSTRELAKKMGRSQTDVVRESGQGRRGAVTPHKRPACALAARPRYHASRPDQDAPVVRRCGRGGTGLLGV